MAEEISPFDKMMAVKKMMDLPGFEHICEEFQKRLLALTVEMEDLNTKADQAEALRQAKGRIKQGFDPRVMADHMVRRIMGGQPPTKSTTHVS